MSTRGPQEPLPSLTPEQKARMEAAMPMVDRRARWMARRRPALTFAQYQSLGYEALWRAALTFDASRGAKFRTYAWQRCCGAVEKSARVCIRAVAAQRHVS